jgi:hypothetical protein
MVYLPYIPPFYHPHPNHHQNSTNKKQHHTNSQTFQIPYVYDYITKLCRQQAEVIQDHDNENVRTIGQGEASHRKYKRLKLGSGQAYCNMYVWYVSRIITEYVG